MLSVIIPLQAILFSIAFAQQTDPELVEYRVAKSLRKVRRRMSSSAGLRGMIYKGDVFAVGEIKGYNGCAAGWAAVSGGYVCLSNTYVVDTPPEPLPKNVGFLPPKPEEIEEANALKNWDFTDEYEIA